HTSLTPDQIDHFYGTRLAPLGPLARPDLGERQWIITAADANTGTQSVRSPVLAPNMTAQLSAVKLTGEGLFRFAYKVVGNGTLTLRIDGTLRLTAPVTGGWQNSSINLSAGYHSFVWVYTTAATVAASDAAF